MLHKYNEKTYTLKITKILNLGAHLKSNNLIVLVFKRGSESKWIRYWKGGAMWATPFVQNWLRWGDSNYLGSYERQAKNLKYLSIKTKTAAS